MSKFGARVYLDKREWEKFKSGHNASQKINEFIKNVNRSGNGKEERIEKINEQIKELKEEIAKAQEQISNLQAEKNTLQTEIEEEMKLESREEKFIKICKKNMEENQWKSPEDILPYWRNKLDKDKEELWELAKKSDLKPAEAKNA